LIEKGFHHVKPYNPILGEHFHCKWEHEDSTTFYHAEQVSHHPPISAIYWENPKKGIIHYGTLGFGMNFLGNSGEAWLKGGYKLVALKHGEVYEASFPKFVGRGIFWGSQVFEKVGKQEIKCEKTGYCTKI